MNIRFYVDPETEALHIYRHGIDAAFYSAHLLVALDDVVDRAVEHDQPRGI